MPLILPLQNVSVTVVEVLESKILQAYVKDCSVYNISDNGVYFAASSYLSDTGCHNCTVDGCTVTLVGNNGLINIGGGDNTFKNCPENTRGGGGSVYET